MNKLLIRIQCRDEVGLVTRITHLLAQHGLNIVSMREFVEEASTRFFTRIECTGMQESEASVREELQACLPDGSIIEVNPNNEKRVAVMVSREYHCLGEILIHHYFGTLGASVCCVIGNHSHLEAFTRKFSIPFFHISHEEKPKEAFEKEVLAVLEAQQPDYIVLAKFMRILSPDFIARYEQRILNIHHSFLPAFVGAQPYRQAFERGVKLIGATAHIVTNNLDEGPIIAQQTIPVNHTFGVKEMIKAGKEIEKAVLNKAMQLLFEDRVFLNENKTIVFE